MASSERPLFSLLLTRPARVVLAFPPLPPRYLGLHISSASSSSSSSPYFLVKIRGEGKNIIAKKYTEITNRGFFRKGTKCSALGLEEDSSSISSVWRPGQSDKASFSLVAKSCQNSCRFFANQFDFFCQSKQRSPSHECFCSVAKYRKKKHFLPRTFLMLENWRSARK